MGILVVYLYFLFCLFIIKYGFELKIFFVSFCCEIFLVIIEIYILFVYFKYVLVVLRSIVVRSRFWL